MVSVVVTEITRHERDRPRQLPALGLPESDLAYAHMAVAPGNEPRFGDILGSDSKGKLL